MSEAVYYIKKCFLLKTYQNKERADTDMADKSPKKIKEKSYLLSNIRYVTSILWKHNKWLTVFPIILIPFTVVSSTLLAYLPKVVIDSLEVHTPLMKILPVIVGVFITLLFIDSMELLITNKRSVMRLESAIHFLREIQKAFAHSHFTATEDPALLNRYRSITGIMVGGRLCIFDRFFSAIVYLLRILSALATYVAIIMTISPVLIIIILASNVILYIVGIKRNKFIVETMDQVYMINGKTGYLNEKVGNLKSAKDVKVLNMQKWLSDLLSSLQSKTLSLHKKISNYAFFTDGLNSLLALIRDGVLYGMLVYLFAAGRIGAGDFTLSVNAVAGFSLWINRIMENITDIKQYNIFINLYKNLVNELNDNKGDSVVSVDEAMMKSPVAIEFENVSFKYPEADDYTLKNINLKINPGEKLAVVGINGAGKTTLVKLLCGFYRPTDGIIKVNGHDVSDYDLEEYYRLFSIVFQDVNLIPVTVEEFISCKTDSDNINRNTLETVIKDANLYSKLSTLKNGVKTRLMKGIYEDGEEFSGGEHQRLALARAIYREASCIILDEPTSALDPIAESDLYKKYDSLTRGKTSVYISHRLASTRFCDKIILLDEGKVIEYGSHDELIQLNGKYRNMYDVQSHYYKQI